jgi:hypothetical protein
VKLSTLHMQRSPAARSSARLPSAPSSSGSPSTFGANVAASRRAVHVSTTKHTGSCISSLLDQTRTVKSNMFSSHSKTLDESTSPATVSVATPPIQTFRSSSQGTPIRTPIRRSVEEEQHHEQGQLPKHGNKSTPPRDLLQPLQLQELLQKLLRQVDEAERQRLVRII